MAHKYQYRLDLLDRFFCRKGRILDVGCGTGQGVKQYADRLGLEPYGIDVVNGNQAPIQFEVYDGLTLPYEDEFFDAVTVVHVLHHAVDPNRLVSEIARVVRRGGRLMIIEDMASSRLQTQLTKASDLYMNKVRNFWLAVTGRRKFDMVRVPMNYEVRSYPQWSELFGGNGLNTLALKSIPHRLIEHGVFILEKSGASPHA
jgi:ubiquinone/menaquinone biosynthesis C-methylase UbiE